MSLRAFAKIEAQRQGYEKIQLYTNSLMGTNVVLYAGRAYTETRREPLGAVAVAHMSKSSKNKGNEFLCRPFSSYSKLVLIPTAVLGGRYGNSRYR